MKTYLRHRTANVIDVKGLVAIEYLDFEGKYKNYSESHDFCELCYVECGDITLQLGGKSLHLEAGNTVFIAPNTEHSYFSSAGNNSRVFVICFECQSHMLKYMSGNIFSATEDEIYCIRKIINDSNGTFTMNEKDQLELIPSPGFGGQQAIILQLEYMLIVLMRRCLSERKSDVILLSGDKFYQDLVDIIVDYLRGNVGKKIALNDICERFNYSRSFICKIFKEQTGSTLITYINKLKIAEAQRLLASRDMTVSEISEALGFSEAKYFGAIFKKLVGISPQAYREKIHKQRV